LEDSRQYRNAEDWANHLLAKGKYAFALHQFRADFPKQSDTANKFALKRLVDKQHIISIHKDDLLQCYHAYMNFVVDEPPTQKLYLQNMEAKIQDDEFRGDIAALIRPTEKYDQLTAFELVRTELLEKIGETSFDFKKFKKQ
jgi:hypothetical protein